MSDVKIGACFPKFRKEFLVECSLEITDSFRPASPSLSADHAFYHLDVMRAPEREVFIMLEQCFGKLKLFVTFFEVSQTLEPRARTEFVFFFLLSLIRA